MDETLANQIAQDTFKLVNRKLYDIEYIFRSSDYYKKVYSDLEGENKYTYLEAETQYNNVIEALKNAGFTNEEEEQEETYNELTRSVMKQ